MSGTTPGGAFRYPYELDSIPEARKAFKDDIDKLMDRDRALEDYLMGATANSFSIDGAGDGSIEVHNSECDNTATGEEAIAIGCRADASGDDSIAIGSDSNTDEDGGIAIGNDANAANVPDGIAIGTRSQLGGGGDDGAIALGVDTVATGGTVAAGSGASGGGSIRCVVIGIDSESEGASGVAVGDGSHVTDAGGTAVGLDSEAHLNSFAGGWTALAQGQFSTAVGPGAQVEANNSQAFGSGATVPSGFERSTAIGYRADVDDDDQIMLGQNTDVATITVVIPGVLVLQSPDNTRWAVTIDNAGVISTAAI